MEQEKTIIYIMSDNRSGSTLLENILSNSPDIVSVGELHHFKSYLNKERTGKSLNWECSCGSPISTCEFWSKVINRLEMKGVDKLTKTEVVKNKLLYFYTYLSSIHNPKNKEIIKTIDKIYESIFEITDRNFIVDSSKNEIQLATLIKYSKFNIKVIFLKRDIRAVVLSKQKWQKKLERKKINLYILLIITYLKRKLQIKVYKKYVNNGSGLRFDYFDLVNELQDCLNKITNFIEINHFEAPTHMEMHNNHSVGGTPNRERRKISYDDSWKKKTTKRPVFRLLGKITDNL